MRLSDFILLDPKEKREVVLHKGVLIGKRKTHLSMIFLFEMGGFYVETFFDITSKDIREFRIFDHTKLLHPYLESIQIDNLLE